MTMGRVMQSNNAIFFKLCQIWHQAEIIIHTNKYMYLFPSYSLYSLLHSLLVYIHVAADFPEMLAIEYL